MSFFPYRILTRGRGSVAHRPVAEVGVLEPVADVVLVEPVQVLEERAVHPHVEAVDLRAVVPPEAHPAAALPGPAGGGRCRSAGVASRSWRPASTSASVRASRGLLRGAGPAADVEGARLVGGEVAFHERRGGDAVAVGEEEQVLAAVSADAGVEDRGPAEAEVLLPDVLDLEPMAGGLPGEGLHAGPGLGSGAVVGDGQPEVRRGLAEVAAERPIRRYGTWL